MKLAPQILNILWFLSFCTAGFASHSNPQLGGGDLNPGIHANRDSLEAFQDMRVGLSIHWGPSSLGGKEISWARGTDIPRETYDAYYKEFRPVNFNAREWVTLAKAGGMRYISLTSKHHDGFSLWFSSVTDYDMESTPLKRDIVRELADACSEAGIVFGSYYSIIDWYHPDYHPQSHGGPGELIPAKADAPVFERYLRFMKTQLRELIVDYGAKIIQFDGEWEHTWNHVLGSDLYLYCRKLNDEVLVNSRTDIGRMVKQKIGGDWDWTTYAGDYEERERMVEWVEGEHADVQGMSEIPWQAWVTIDRLQWSYNETPGLMSPSEVVHDLLAIVGDNGNYMINLGPRPDGSFHPEQVAVVREVGDWLKYHGLGIYGTRGGPWRETGSYTSTVRDGCVYLFVLDPSKTGIVLPLQDKKVTSVEPFGQSSSTASIKVSEEGLHLHFQGKPDTMGVRAFQIHLEGSAQ
ncbi:MAG: alpha-L-fucosidase [Puniceicoccaceae bacterium]